MIKCSSLKVLSVGKKTDRDFAPAIRKYTDSLRKFTKLDFSFIRPEKSSGGIPPGEIVKKESPRILEYIGTNKRTFPIALDSKGTLCGSREFSRIFLRAVESGETPLFIIGGIHGFSKSVREKARKTISLSKLTFNHQLAGLILLEQVYRSFCIINNMEYHR
ncbi:MAG: 23S rRNA (pseudouridine(1915)-N(3))-methyltransferase RlmH [Fibrobacterota bacterium]